MAKYYHILFKCFFVYVRCLNNRFSLFLFGISIVIMSLFIVGNDLNSDTSKDTFTVIEQNEYMKSNGGNDDLKGILSQINVNIANSFTQNVASSRKEDLPTVIVWNKLQQMKEYDITCKSFRCHVTHNHEARHSQDVLGIIFYGSDFGRGGLPLPRKPGHLWSVLHDESPKNNNWFFCAKDSMKLFNLTSTFSRESHYPFPTMWLKDEKDLTSNDFVTSLAEKNELRKKGLAPIVFVHSDCKTASDRSHYMRLLQQYIQIDSYGKCDHNKDFPNRNMTFEAGMAPMISPQFYKLLSQYKFTFAFENAVCDDYITEKFWRSLHLGVVPIVFGSPKIKDFAPSENVMLDIRDFPSVEELAKYIAFLDTHDDEYAKYLDFKRTGIKNTQLRTELDRRDWGRGKAYDSLYTGFNCFVCEKLNHLRKQIHSGKQVQQWQGDNAHYSCPKPRLFSENGSYIVETNKWDESLDYASFYLQSFRYHIVNNVNADFQSIHTLARVLQNKEQF